MQIKVTPEQRDQQGSITQQYWVEWSGSRDQASDIVNMGPSPGYPVEAILQLSYANAMYRGGALALGYSFNRKNGVPAINGPMWMFQTNGKPAVVIQGTTTASSYLSHSTILHPNDSQIIIYDWAGADPSTVGGVSNAVWWNPNLGQWVTLAFGHLPETYEIKVTLEPRPLPSPPYYLPLPLVPYNSICADTAYTTGKKVLTDDELWRMPLTGRADNLSYDGEMKANFGVKDSTGAALYSIPIDIPQGCRGVRILVPGTNVRRDAFLVDNATRKLVDRSDAEANEDCRLLLPKNINEVPVGLHTVLIYAHPLFLGVSGTRPSIKIDCLMSGRWLATPGRPGKSNDKVLVGLEGDIPAPSSTLSGRVTVISHGRQSSPLRMKPLGDAAGTAWGNPVLYVNWSEGSCFNTGWPLKDVLKDYSLNGARFISDTAAVTHRLLFDAGVTNAENIDFLGHSWGTYLGNMLPREFGAGGMLGRLVALDPATLDSQFQRLFVNFRKAALHSLSLVSAYGIYGSASLGATADNTVLVVANDFRPQHSLHDLRRHELPVEIMRQALESWAALNGPTHHSIRPILDNTLGYFLSSGSAVVMDPPWVSNTYNSLGIMTPDKLEVVYKVDDLGNVVVARYVSRATGQEVTAGSL